ncbi:MAG: hypothetical protein U0800_21180 [Isosphaeraceae bacterium]
MRTRSCRKPDIFDAMILPVFLLVVIWLYQWLYPPIFSWPLWTQQPGDYVAWVHRLTAFPHIAWPIFYSATLSMLAVRLRGPRAPLRRLTCQPGAVASLTAFTYGASQDLAYYPIRDLVYLDPSQILEMYREPDPRWVHDLFGPTNQGIGYAVLAAWIILILGGRWRPEPGWIDRLGIALGSAWIVRSLADSIGSHW